MNNSQVNQMNVPDNAGTTPTAAQEQPELHLPQPATQQLQDSALFDADMMRELARQLELQRQINAVITGVPIAPPSPLLSIEEIINMLNPRNNSDNQITAEVDPKIATDPEVLTEILEEPPIAGNMTEVDPKIANDPEVLTEILEEPPIAGNMIEVDPKIANEPEDGQVDAVDMIPIDNSKIATDPEAFEVLTETPTAGNVTEIDPEDGQVDENLNGILEDRDEEPPIAGNVVEEVTNSQQQQNNPEIDVEDIEDARDDVENGGEDQHDTPYSPVRTNSSNVSSSQSSPISSYGPPSSPVPPEDPSDVHIYIESVNDGKYKLTIFKELFEGDVSIQIDSNSITAVGKLKQNDYVEIASEGIGILSQYMSMSRATHAVRLKLKRELEAKLVNYKGARVSMEAYNILVAQDALSAFNDNDDDDEAPPRPRQQRKRRASDLQAPNPKRRRIAPKPKVRRARPARRPSPPAIIAPATPPMRLPARLAARQNALNQLNQSLSSINSTTPPQAADPSNIVNQSPNSSTPPQAADISNSVNRSLNSSTPPQAADPSNIVNQSPTNSTTPPANLQNSTEIKTIEEADEELVKIETALKWRSFGFRGLDILTQHKALIRLVKAYKSTPTPVKLQKILDKTTSLRDDVEQYAQ
ncbi:unnamed protein product [Caenorhabditis angaria]|uniref:Uncharacterized protein n=1 Tax=Caenorhabditis angaria TaxID=860376 RepID=A0A9P1N3X5_9PELO|nr:unnamed protein product [Caenorhabditis angaria]